MSLPNLPRVPYIPFPFTYLRYVILYFHPPYVSLFSLLVLSCIFTSLLRLFTGPVCNAVSLYLNSCRSGRHCRWRGGLRASIVCRQGSWRVVPTLNRRLQKRHPMHWGREYTHTHYWLNRWYNALYLCQKTGYISAGVLLYDTTWRDPNPRKPDFHKSVYHTSAFPSFFGQIIISHIALFFCSYT